MIFVFMHWHEKDSSDSSVEPDPLTDRLEADVHTFLVARATSHKWCEGQGCSAPRSECPNVSVALDCSYSMGKRCSRQMDCLSGKKPGLKCGSSLPIKHLLPLDCAKLACCLWAWIKFFFSIKRLKHLSPFLFVSFPLQGGSSWMPQEKERVRQMSGKPRGCVGKPKQDPDWRAESTEGHLLPQSWVAAAVCGHGLKTAPLTDCYSKTKQNKKNTKQKRLWNKNCFDRLCFSAHSGLVYSEASRGYSNSSSLPVLLLFLSCGLCMWRLKCRTHYALLLLYVHGDGFGEGGGNASQWEPAWSRGNRKRKYRCFLKMCRSSAEIMTNKPGQVSRVSLTSKFLWGQTRCTQSSRRSTTSCNQATQPCLPDNVIRRHVRRPVFLFLVVSCIPSCENTITEKYLQRFRQWSDFLEFINLVFFFSLYRSSWFGHKRFFKKTTSEREVQDERFGSVCVHRTLKMYFKPLDNVQKEPLFLTT